MKTVNVCIPTISRFELIRKTIHSILAGNYENVIITIIVDDGRKAYYEKLKRRYSGNDQIKILYNEKRLGWPCSLNRIFKETDDDLYFFASDDLLFRPNTIQRAVANMEKHFPDGDGLIGISQNLNQYCPAAFGLIGRKWVNRFPDRQVMYPKYVHFAGDSEHWHYAKQKNRFYKSHALVYHARPFDECKRKAQKTLLRDRAIWFPRRDSKHFWPDYP